jgi:hypothetical protein
MNQQNSATSMEMSFSNFDFNMSHMKFIAGLFTNIHSAKVAKLAEDIRLWGLARSANSKSSVAYQVRIHSSRDMVVSGSEFISLTTDEVLSDVDNILSVSLSSYRREDWDTFREAVNPAGALTLYDQTLRHFKSQLGDVNLSAYVALRHLIASAARFAQVAQVQDESISFEYQDGNMVHVFKVVIPHIAPRLIAGLVRLNDEATA